MTTFRNTRGREEKRGALGAGCGAKKFIPSILLVSDQIRGIAGGRRVGHRHNPAKTAARGCGKSRCGSLCLWHTWISKMNMDVDESGKFVPIHIRLPVHFVRPV